MWLNFHGGSWTFGVISAAVYFGNISVWWLLITPFLLIGYKPIIWTKGD